MQPKRAPVSIADYLAAEDKSDRKHEYIDGEIHAMSGATRRHNLLASNIQAALWNAAKHVRNCKVFGSDMKLYVEAFNSLYYPDLTVSCDPSDNNELYLTRPCFIVEVMSPSTAGIDRREKRTSYLTLPSLREYITVDQDRLRVQVYGKQAGVWLTQVLDQPADIVESSCLNLRLSLSDIYAGVALPSRIEEPEADYMI